MSSVKRSKNRRQNGTVRDEVNITTSYLVKRGDCGWVIIRTVVIFYWSLSIYIYAVRHTHIVHHNTEYITPISPITSDLLQSQSPSTLPNSIPVIASYSTISISLEKGICVLMRPLCVLVTVPARLRSDVQLWTECKQAGVRRLHGVPVESRRSLK